MLLSPLRYINPISGNRGGSAAFSIAKSFYLDGVNEAFVVDANDINSYISGTNKQFTLNFCLKRTEINAFNHFFGEDIGNGMFIRFNSTNELSFFIYNGGYTSMITTSTFADTSDFYLINIVYDGVTPSNSKIYVNGVDEALSSNNLGSVIQNGTSNYLIGGRLSADYFNGYYSSFSVIDRLLTPTEITSYYNNGKPKDAQALFGANCKFFFNPDNSGDTSQFTVSDSVNNIDAISVNMTDADKTPITPYADPISDLVTKYGFLNAWSGENIEINGTTTTAKDYASEHDLVNPAVANQPTFVGASSLINNRPLIDFDFVDDYLIKNVVDWRGSDGSGCITYVSRIASGSFDCSLTTADSTTINDFVYGWYNSSRIRFTLKDASFINTIFGTPTYTTTNFNIITIASNGSEYFLFLNGEQIAFTMQSGSNDGKWLDDVNNRDNISIGGLITSSQSYSGIDFAFSGYHSFTSIEDTVTLQNELKTIFGI